MSTRMRDALTSRLASMRHEPTAKRIRAVIGDETVVDSTHALLLWEPRRIVPSYAVPEEDVQAVLTPGRPGEAVAAGTGARMPELSDRPVLDPSVPFAAHTTDGTALDLRAAGRDRPGAAFRLADPGLAGYVVLDFTAFDGWLEEDEPNLAHPRDPFHRIDVLTASRHVRVELEGHVLAESSRPTLLFETMLPTRFYLPRDDVQAEMVPSARRTFCAYKGEASYFSVAAAGHRVDDLVWTYEAPLHEAARIRGLVCFFNERVDIVLDGDRQDRPLTPWSPRH